VECGCGFVAESANSERKKRGVDETDLAKVKMNQKAVITLDAYPDQAVDGTVHRISFQSTLVNNVTTYEVDVWPSKVPAFMRSGMTANVVFTVDEKQDVLVMPSEALQQEGGHSFVLAASPDPKGKPQTVTVETGITDGKMIEVVSGLKEGDKVLTSTFAAGQIATPNNTNPFMPSAKPSSPRRGGGGR
jgi:macrolide-specific efflux system membrane fusion protein